MDNSLHQQKNLGDLDSDLSLSESQVKAIKEISKDITPSTLIVFWQFILKGLEELSIVANPILSLEMLIIRLIHLKDMPKYDEILNLLNNNNPNQNDENIAIKSYPKINLKQENEINKTSKDQIKNTIQTKPKLTTFNPKDLLKDPETETILSFEDLIKLSSKKKEVELKYDLERNTNLIKFVEGKIDISFNENLGKDFVRNLTEKLLKWTGKRWLITLTKEKGGKTFSELRSIKEQETLEEEKKSEVYKKFKSVFSDVELVEVSKKNKND